MARTPDNELRTTVIDVKPDGKRFRAAMEDGRVQEFTLSTQGYIAPPTVGQDIIIKYNIQASSNPKWPDPTFWANEIMPAANGQSAPPIQGTYDQARAAVAEATAEPKKASYQAESDARNQSIEMQVCLKAAVEITNQWDGGVASAQVIEVALALHDGIFCGKAMPTHDEAMAAHDGWPTDATTPVQQGEPEPQYSG